MRKILAVFLMITSLSAFAEDHYLDTSGLTEQQKAEMAVQVAKLKTEKTEPANISEKVRTEAQAWGDLGANMGKALVGGAKEIGVAANEFAETPLGKITIAVVVFKLMGGPMLHIIAGTIFLLFGWGLGIWMMKTMRIGVTHEYDYKPFLWGMWNRKVVVEESSESNSDRSWRIITGVIVLIVATVIGLITLFNF